MNRGTFQGGVLSALLWNIVVENLINSQTDDFEVEGYADDLAILKAGIDSQTLSIRCNQALITICRWCAVNGLGINPKTQH